VATIFEISRKIELQGYNRVRFVEAFSRFDTVTLHKCDGKENDVAGNVEEML